MAITRMQQPRQMYGLGSFVKKITRKVTKPFTKVARKIVPKEIAGIMRVAAPFLGPQFGPAAYLLGTAKQTGRISPVDLALASIPKLSKINVDKAGIQRFLPEVMQGYDTLGESVRAVNIPFTGGETSIGDVLFGDSGGPGIFGSYGEPVNILSSDGPSFRETSTFQKLLGKKGKPEEFDLIKTGAFGASALSLIKDAKTPEEAGTKLVEATGNPDDYEEGVRLFSTLPAGIFDIRPEFRLPAQAGGLMRENYALGTMPTAQESGLGGLPIEADMRYTGGFMPYGAKEKADDVPARLSKNEFVFTADAVRGAGGVDINTGAKRMYQSMKQLEQMGKRA